MTTSLSVTANVKKLRTGGSFRILLPFFRTSWDVDVLNSAFFNRFHIRVELGTILEGLRNFGGGGEGFNPPPLGTPLVVPIFLYLPFYLFLAFPQSPAYSFPLLAFLPASFPIYFFNTSLI